MSILKSLEGRKGTLNDMYHSVTLHCKYSLSWTTLRSKVYNPAIKDLTIGRPLIAERLLNPIQAKQICTRVPARLA